MGTRIELQAKLEEMLGSRNVYYQPPETIKMEYPAIVYSKSDVNSIFANDEGYLQSRCYDITVIDHRPDNVVIDKLLKLPMCTFSRHYKADNLNHDILRLYF